jgi:hypothetical protein
MAKAILYAILLLSTFMSGCFFVDRDRDRDRHHDREYHEDRHEEHHEGRY